MASPIVSAVLPDLSKDATARLRTATIASSLSALHGFLSQLQEDIAQERAISGIVGLFADC
eukprot:1108-Alexandrium_andersonii.AAC.1